MLQVIACVRALSHKLSLFDFKHQIDFISLCQLLCVCALSGKLLVVHALDSYVSITLCDFMAVLGESLCSVRQKKNIF